MQNLSGSLHKRRISAMIACSVIDEKISFSAESVREGRKDIFSAIIRK